MDEADVLLREVDDRQDDVRRPVVAELDSTCNEAVRVYHHRGGAWADVTAQVGWVKLNFELEEY